MIIEDLIGPSVGVGIREVDTIKRECSLFLHEAKGQPLMKQLPSTSFNFQKVKVRLQKRRDQVSDVFEQAFGEQFPKLRQRAVYAYPRVLAETPGHDLFYVFPINGYKYLYNKEVQNSSTDYQPVLETLLQQLDTQEASEIASELLKYSYVNHTLSEAFASGAEVIFYSIPYYYAVRASACGSYESLLGITKT